ncbi:hypothetical protein SRHO_G00094490 [Serrasalmus rhombeus]
MCILRKKIRILHEWHRRWRHKRARKQVAFISNPFKFTKDLLGQKHSGKLASSQEETHQHLTQMYSDPRRVLELGECNILIDPPEPEVQFDLTELQLKEVKEVVHKAKARSAPGPSDISYKVYKNCPKLLLHLWKILRVFWRKGKIPEQWRVAEGVWIPKEEDSTQLDQFPIISLLCIGAKIFFSAISKRLCTYLTKNTYIETSVQKGSISGMLGCVEHTGTAIPTITENPVKSLSEVFDGSLRDSTSIQLTCAEVDGWLKSVDKSDLPGKFKAWVYQHGFLPRILRPLLIYAVPRFGESSSGRDKDHARQWSTLRISLWRHSSCHDQAKITIR